MTPLKRVVITAVAFVGATAVAAANTPSNVLNKLEVQKLVAMERPVADLALAVHFNALADRYLDTFFALGLIPKQIKISDVARRSGS